ncbi:MAG: type IX secretion system outer membrane channel protein PorV [Paludibacteraceae bacterium]|nr:type IX secretion system outer membrane channel protein PorV [Paludibacteraceae bacterium]
MKKLFSGVFAFSMALLPLTAFGEKTVDDSMNPLITAMPSLSIAPDAHAGGLGDVGAATTPDINSQHWNPAKYAFLESHGGISASYTPWLTAIVRDINLAYVSGYYKWDDLQGISASLTYFGLGEVQLTDYNGLNGMTAKPNEFAIDVAYSRKLHEYVSMAVALRFLYSDMHAPSTGGTPDMYPGMTGAADVALYYRQPIQLGMGMSHFGLGLNISNLGGKISYDKGNTSNFIPANLRLGVSYELPFDDYNRLSFNADINKMLVPSRKSKFAVDENGDPLTGQALTDWYTKMSSVQGWFRSFADAPGYSYTDTKTGNIKTVSPALEELQEIQFGVGVEYSYNRQFFARVGYSHENMFKGNRRYVTFGAGFKLSIFSLDAGYVLATSASNPLNNTFRVTLGFDLAGIKDLIKN